MSGPAKARKRAGGWSLYILLCGDGTFYTGITNDLDRRIELHNSGKASRYTRSRRPVTLLYKEGCRDRSNALRKECGVKALTRKEKEEYIRTHKAGSSLGAKRKR